MDSLPACVLTEQRMYACGCRCVFALHVVRPSIPPTLTPPPALSRMARVLSVTEAVADSSQW